MSQRDNALQIFRAAVGAVDPYRSVLRVLGRDGDALVVRQGSGEMRLDLEKIDRLHVVGCGKAGAPMARAVEELVGDRISTGIVVVKYGHTLSDEASVDSIRICEGGHPKPDAAGMHRAEEILGVLQGASERDLVLALISGGGSALCPLPAPPITLAEKTELTRQLLASGADIHDINVVRKHVSLIKGGGAAKFASPARVLVLLVSDVIGDRLDSIASGPFAPDASTFGEALEIVERHGLATEIPISIQVHLWDGFAGKMPETPKSGDSVFERVTHCICASNAQALEGAREAAASMGYFVEAIERPIDGDVGAAAESFCSRLEEIAEQRRERPACLIGGGETTVRLGQSPGKGGRNQQFALACAFEIQGKEELTVLSCGTDGTDGPTDAAGAVVDGSTIDRCRSLGLDSRKALESRDVYPLFEQSGDLVKTGPTHSNVMDIMLGIVT